MHHQVDTLYVLVRTDLLPEQQTVQACHAVAEAVHHFRALANTHPHFVICAVPDEAALLRALSELRRLGIRARLFVEPDLRSQATALATEPVCGERRRAFRRYPLLRFPQLQLGQDGRPHRTVARPQPEGGLPMTTSRFGHHPCSYDVFLQLKRIHKAYHEGLRLLAARRRWERKQPHNRVRVRPQRDESGRRVGRVHLPWPEPVVPAVVREICESRYDLVKEYDNARHGVPLEQLRPLGIPEAVLRDWTARLAAQTP